MTQILDRRLRTTEGAGGIALYLDLAKTGGERVVDQEMTREAVADAEQLLQDLGRLQAAHGAREGAKNAGGFAARNKVLGRPLRKEAAVAGMRFTQIGLVGRNLRVEPQECRRGEGLAQQIAGVVEQEARREVVAAVGDQIV